LPPIEATIGINTASADHRSIACQDRDDKSWRSARRQMAIKPAPTGDI